MKVLVTGFDPFGGERVNPAYEAVKALPAIVQSLTAALQAAIAGVEISDPAAGTLQ